MPISRTELFLAQLAAAQPRADRFLSALLVMADRHGGIGFPINVIVDGVLIHGRVGSSDEFAGALDQGLAGGLSELAEAEEGSTVGEIAAEAAKVLEGEFSASVARQRLKTNELQKRHEAYAAKANIDIDTTPILDMPEDLAFDIIELQAPPRAFTLKDAVAVSGLGQTNEPLGTIRVHTTNVSAWWPGFDLTPANAPTPDRH
jgi:hypothetical protein